MNGKELLRLYQQRDERAVEETSRAYGGLLRQIAQNILGNPLDAEECVNDALLSAWNAIPPAEPEYFRAYLAAVTRSIALNRRAERMAAKRGGGQIPLVLEELQACIPSGEDVEQVLDRIAVQEVLDRFLRELPDRHCRIFLRRYFSMMPVEDIAAELKLNVNTVKSVLRRTRTKLRKTLEKEELL